MNENIEQKYYIGIDLNSRKVVCMLIDCHGNILDQQEIFAEVYRGMDVMIERLYDTIFLLLKEHGIPHAMLERIGLALPSHRVGAGKLPYHFANWEGVDLKKSLAQRIGTDVYLVSYGAASGMGEYYQHQSENIHHILALDVFDTMTSAALIVDGQIYSATGDDYLDVGHFVVDIHGTACSCGKRGCLDVMGTGNAALYYYEDFTHRRIGMGELKRRMQGGNKVAIHSFDYCAEHISMCLTNLMTLFAPDKICLGGDFILNNPYLFEHIAQQVRIAAGTDINICLNTLRENSEAYGAGIIAMNKECIHRY